jgi:hypothetical protein
MDGVKALVVLASIYYPGDGIVAKNNYQTSSGERYDQSAPTPAVDKALHLGGLGSVRVEYYPPLPKARPVDPQIATLVADPMDTTVKPPAELKVWVDPHLKASEPKKTVRLLARRPVTRQPQTVQPFWQVTFP